MRSGKFHSMRGFKGTDRSGNGGKNSRLHCLFPIDDYDCGAWEVFRYEKMDPRNHSVFRKV